MVVRYGGTLTGVFFFCQPLVAHLFPILPLWNEIREEFVLYMLRGVQQLPCCCGPMYNKDEVGQLDCVFTRIP